MDHCNRRAFLSMTGLGIAALASVPFSCQGKHRPKHPNIVYILADDLGYGDVKCLNPDSKIPTPNLDNLAQQGMTFTDAHANSSLCSPTRYGILTGRYSWRSRGQGGALWAFDPPLIEAKRLTAPQLLKNHGYHTACIGKWHLGLNWRDRKGDILAQTGAEKGWNIDFSRPLENGPTTHGFDYFFGMDAPNYPPYCYIENNRTLGIPTVEKPRSMYGVPGLMLKDWDLLTVLPQLEKRAVAHIRKRAMTGSPFFLYFPLTGPHTPIAPIEKHRGKSQAGAYGDFVHQIDHVVGSVMRVLKQTGTEENTLLIFTSDNGSPGRDGANMAGELSSVHKYNHYPSYVYRGRKADIWEGGHRVPFLVRWPQKIKAGSQSNDIICHTDLFATCAALLGETLPDHAGEDSYNILPLLTGENHRKPLREATVHLSGDGSFSIRQGKWKMAICPGSGGGDTISPETAMRKKMPMIQLYDLDNDIGEQHNLHKDYPDVVYHLTKSLENYVSRGRSTPGRPQKNTGEPDIWRSLDVRTTKFDTNPVDHLAVSKKVQLLNNASLRFAKNGINVLTDGVRASSWFDDGYWVGIENDDLDILLDLGKEEMISTVSVGCLEAQAYWIFHPLSIECSLSEDGNEFFAKQCIKRQYLQENETRVIHDFVLHYRDVFCRYVRIKATGVKTCPQWHKGAGGKAWLLIDEVMIK
jgi:arylsulfatase A